MMNGGDADLARAATAALAERYRASNIRFAFALDILLLPGYSCGLRVWAPDRNNAGGDCERIQPDLARAATATLAKRYRASNIRCVFEGDISAVFVLGCRSLFATSHCQGNTLTHVMCCEFHLSSSGQASALTAPSARQRWRHSTLSPTPVAAPTCAFSKTLTAR
mgnify:FL=1